MKVIGSNIENLSRQNFLSGIQRIAIETHKKLFDLQSLDQFQIFGVKTNISELRNSYTKNNYFKSDPILTGKLIELNAIDILLLLDYDFTLNFTRLHLLKQHNKIKIVSVIYDLIPIYEPDLFDNGQNFRKLFQIYIQKISFLSDVIIFNSKKALNDFKALNFNCRATLVVIHLGAVKNDLEAPPFSLPTNTIITVGTIEPRKQHNLIIEAFNYLIENNHDFKLFIVGNYGWLVDKTLFTNHSEFAGKLRWFQNLNDQEVARLYRISSIAVCASKDEGFGLPIEEALSNHVKVLANDIPTFTERAQSNLYFFNGTSEHLANKIVELENVKFNSTALEKVRLIDNFAEELLHFILQI